MYRTHSLHSTIRPGFPNRTPRNEWKRESQFHGVRGVAGFLLAFLFPILSLPVFSAEVLSREETGQISRTEKELEIWNDPTFRKRLMESYQAETDIEPRVTEAERNRMQRVFDLIASGKLNEAAAMLESQRSEAASAVFDFTLANIHFQQEQYERAAEAYRTAVEKFPRFRRAWKNLGIIHIRQGDLDQAIVPLTRVLELGGNDAITYGLLGFAYSSAENHLSAESAYRMAILLDPATLDWKMGLAKSLFRQERYPEAVSLCRQLIENQPERADLWLLQANAYLGLRQPLRAAENLEIVDLLGGATPAGLFMLGDIYVNEELYEPAVRSYLRALEAAPSGFAERAVLSAKILAGRGAHMEAERLLERIEILAANELTEESRGEMLKLHVRLAVARGSSEEEVRILEEIVALNPLDGEALILLGQHSSRSGDPEMAIFYYERAAAIEKFEADARVRHAQLLVSSGRYNEALPLLRRAQQIRFRENVQEYLEQVERVARNR